MIGSQGETAKRQKDQKIWLIDEKQGELLKLHKDVQAKLPHLQGRPSREKCVILEKEIRRAMEESQNL
jgi:ligand-binding sensor domain-containing protein